MCASLQLSQPDPRILHQPSYWFQGWWQSHSWTSLASIFLNFPAAARSQLEATMSWVMRDGLRLSASCWESWKTKQKKRRRRGGEGREEEKIFSNLVNPFFCYYVDKLSTYEWNGPSNIKGCVSESWGLWTSVSLYHSLPVFFCSRYNFLIQLAREHLLHRLYVYDVLLY